MASIVRQSKFRHVFCKPVKHEATMSAINITEITWDSQFAAVNPRFIAIINKGSGGPFLVIPVNKVGRIDKDYPFVDAHKAPCLEVQFSPFNDNVIASCSEDATAKVWLIPEKGLTRTLSTPVVELVGHQKRVNTLMWHPSALNILLTAGGENKLLMWNVGTGEAILEIAGHPDQIFSLAFNYDGSRILTTCRDRMLRIIDAHSGDILNEGMGHEGVKPQRAIFTKDGRVFTTGFTKRSERLYALRQQDQLGEPIMQEELDTSNGVLFPLYDEDSGLMYLAGKGDCAIRYYEVNNDFPFVHYINTYTSSEPQRGMAFMAKRGLNATENEINRIYKITPKGVVDILQFFVPRKSDLWQADLYPDTRSMEAAMTAEQWMSGENAPPKLVPVNPGAAEAKPKVQVVKRANILAQAPQQQQVQIDNSQRNPPPSRSPPLARVVSSEHTRAANEPHMDEDMGIVRVERSTKQTGRAGPASPPATNPMIPKHSVQLRSTAELGGAQTAGQARAAKELEKIRREQTRTADIEGTTTPSDSRRHSNASTAQYGNEPTNMEELLNDLAKIKQVLRQHERRIRTLEDALAEANMAAAYGL